MPFFSSKQHKEFSIRYLLLFGILVFFLLAFSLYRVSYILWENSSENALDSKELTFNILSAAIAVVLEIWILITLINREKHIHSEKQSFFALLDNSPLAIYLHDTEGNIILFNKTAHTMLGYSHEEMQKLKLKDFVVNFKKSLESEQKIWNNLREGREITRTTTQCSKSGLLLDTEVTVTKLPIFGSHHILAYVKDITARKLAEKSLKEQTERLQLALKGTQAGMWDMNLINDTIVIDERWAEMLGYKMEELMPLNLKKAQDLFHQGDMITSNETFENHLKGKVNQYSARLRAKHQKGHWVTVWSSGQITERDELGNPIRMTGTNVDVTELTESQKALEESEAMFRAVVNSLDDSIYVLDQSLVCKEAYGKIFKEDRFTKKDIIGKTASQTLGDEVGGKLQSAMEAALSGDSTRVNWEFENLFYQTSYSKIINNHQEVIGLVGLTRDVTKEKTDEIKLLTEKERMDFLVNSGNQLNQLISTEETYEFITKTLDELMDHTGLVIAVDYTNSQDSFTIISMAGSPVLVQQLNNFKETPLIGLSAKRDLTLVEGLTSHKIVDLTQLAIEGKNALPPELKELIQTLSREFRFKTLGIAHKDVILGNISFLHNPEISQLDEELITTFINQASAVLEKNVVLNALSENRIKLQISERKYKKLVNTAPVIIYEYDITEGAKYYSEQVANILGYSDEYLISSNLWEQSIHPIDLVKVKNAEKSFQEGNSFDIEYRIKHKNGEWRWFRDLSMNHGESDQLIRGMVMDITEEKRLSQLILEQFDQLKEQDIVLRMAIESAQQGVFDWNLVSDHLTWNAEFLNIFAEANDSDLTFYEYFYGFVTKEDRATLAPKLEKVFSGEASEIDEVFRISTNDGIKWIKVTGNLIEKTEDGKGLRLIGTMMNITAMKEAERAREEYTRQLKLIVESIPGIVFSCFADEEYTMEFISDYTETITGYTAASFYDNEVIFYNLIHLDDQENVRRTIEEAFQDKRRYSVSYRIISKSGEVRWLNEVGEFRSYNPEIETNKIDGVIFDITDNIKSEERMLNATIDATDRERMRIALEIHNNIQQTLVNAYLSFESMKPDMVKFGEKQQQRFLNGLKSLNTGLEDTRLIARTLMPKQVQDFGYVDSVENLIANLHPDIQFDFYHNIEERFDEKTELNLFRITQEALDNIVKHADAKQVYIQLIKHDKNMTLTIDDDGVGFDAKNIEIIQSGYGIHAMKSRAANIGARFELSSQPGRGTYMLVDIPLTTQLNPVNYV